MSSEAPRDRKSSLDDLSRAEIASTEPGYKWTEAGIIPNDWAVSYVGAEFTIQLGKMLDAARNSGTIKPYLGNRSVQWGRFELEDIAYVPMTPTDLEKYRLRRNDLLVCEGGEIGRAAIWNEPIPECYYQKALHRLRSKGDYDVRLMMYFLQRWTSTGYLANYVTQTSIAHLPKDKLALVPLPVPPRAEQHTFAEVLNDADELLSTLDILVAKVGTLKQSVMRLLLDGEIRLPGFSGEWESAALGDGILLISGHHVLAQHCNSRGDGVPYLTGPADFPEGRIRQTKFTTKPTTLCEPGDILVTVKGSGAGTLVVSDGVYCISRQLMAIRVLAWDRRFVYYSLSQTAGRFKAAVSGLIPGLSRTDILRQRIRIPRERAEQSAIATVLSDIETEIGALEMRRDKTSAIKRGIIQQLLTGRVRLVNSHETVPQS